MTDPALARSRALWNRSTLNLDSDETLAQLLDVGEMAAWRALYQHAREDPEMRQRMWRLVRTVPLGMPHFWLAALSSLGVAVDYDVPVPALDSNWV